MSNYWKMNRLGFINFWKFKKEEFFFSDGCALVRGHNGSGKSIVIQSAVTFLLDGSMRKLDPSGTNAREMSYYLIGEEKKESTGYIYMEFSKGKTYAAIGIGMRAVRNRGVDFWGFGLMDGRRPEKDFSFYKNGIPLTKQECRLLIGTKEGNFFTDKRREYEKETNKMLFGLSTSRYKELISLLSEIRKPIAGADRNAGLKFIYDKLNNSLSSLREEDFDALVSSMEMMDEYNEKLQILKDDHEKVALLNARYEDYMKSLQYKKHLEYIKESARAEKKHQEYNKIKEEYDRIFEKRKKLYEELTVDEIELSEVDMLEEYPDQEKRNTRLSVLNELLEKAEDNRREAAENQNRCEYEIGKTESDLNRIEQEIREMEEEFTWTPDLEENIRRLISLYSEIEAIPEPAVDQEKLKISLIKYLESCCVYKTDFIIGQLSDILEKDSIEPVQKIIKAQECLLDAFLLKNNHYVERNGYLKYQNQTKSEKDEQREILENNQKREQLLKEYKNIPVLTPLILLDPEMEVKRRKIREKIKEAEKISLFSPKSSLKEYRILYDRIRSYESLVKEKGTLEKEQERKKELYEYFISLSAKYEEEVLTIKGEINVLEKAMNEHFSDVLKLRERIIELRSEIRNFDTYVIPQRKEILKEKEDAWKVQEERANKLKEFAEIPEEMENRSRKENQLNQEHVLVEEFMKQKMELHRYQPVLYRNDDGDEDVYSLIFTHQGKTMEPSELEKILGSEIEGKNKLLSQEENNIYQKVLMDCLVEKINHQIDSAKDWIQRIRENMISLETTSGIVFGLRWVRTREIVDFSEYFKGCMEAYREENDDLNYMECIRECFDYRNWFEFRLEMNGKTMNNKKFLTLSGGERATAIYSTLLSALTTMFNECRKEDHPRFFALDEAFTVVDSENIESVFGFIHSVGLDYLMNSQTLWGTYPTVNSLSISNLTNLKDSQSVIVHRFLWKNNRKIPQFSSY